MSRKIERNLVFFDRGIGVLLLAYIWRTQLPFKKLSVIIMTDVSATRCDAEYFWNEGVWHFSSYMIILTALRMSRGGGGGGVRGGKWT